MTKEELRAYHREYQRKRREDPVFRQKASAAARRYYAKNKEICKMNSLEKYHAEPEKRRKTSNEWKKNNSQRVSVYRKQYNLNNAQRLIYYRKQVWGLSKENFEALLLAQASACTICKQPETIKLNGTTKTLCVDHDHITGKIRGLLCNNCNVALGSLKDDIGLLKQAIIYLESEGTKYYAKG